MDTSWYVVNVEAVIIKDAYYLMIVRGAKESHAPGALSFVGGKVEFEGNQNDILEKTLHREVQEEVSIELDNRMEYLESKVFMADDNEPVVDVVFMCRYKSGIPRITDEGEVAAIQWMTSKQILDSSATPDWTRRSIEKAEHKRAELGW